MQFGFSNKMSAPDLATVAEKWKLDPEGALHRRYTRRGLLEDTLGIWGDEFGRTPVSEKGNGRDHNPYGFTMWMAGGGVKPGIAYGATDEFGFKP